MADGVYISQLPRAAELTDDTLLVTDDGSTMSSAKLGDIEDRFKRWSNENLLDNWYFADPINQRGETSLSATINYTYFIDRWILYMAGAVGSLGNNGIKLTAPSSAYASLFQRLEKTTVDLKGKTLTVSALFGDNQLLSATGIITETTSNVTFASASALSNTRTVRLAYTPGNGIYAEFGIGEGNTEIIKAMKLELGDKQTIAHQDENGNWILNDPPPNKALELAKCQRYQLVLNSNRYTWNTIGSGDAFTTGRAFIFVPTPVSMRANPTVTYDGAPSLRAGNTYISVTSLKFYRLSNNGVALDVGSSELEGGKVYTLIYKDINLGQIIFDANL